MFRAMKKTFEKIRSALASRSRFGGRRGELIVTVLCVALALLALGLALYYIYGPGEGYFHSDCTDSILWANASVEAGKTFDENFKYAALLPFSSGIWLVPLIRVFGLSMTAHNAGMAIFAVLFALAIWFFARSAGYGVAWSSLSVFAAFMLLSGSDKLRELMWGHTIYYSLGILLLIVTLGLAIRAENAVEKNKKTQYVYLLLLGAVALGTATDGLQLIAIATLPVAAALAAEKFFCGKEKLFSGSFMPKLLIVCVLALFSLVGLRVLDVMTDGGKISAGYADAYSGLSEVSAWLGNSQRFFGHWFALFGVETPDFAVGGELTAQTLIDLATFAMRTVCGVVLLILPIVMFFAYGKLRERSTRYVLWAHTAVSAVIMFGFICGKLSNANWRLTPMLGSSVFVAIAACRELCLAAREKIAVASVAEGADKEGADGETSDVGDSDTETAGDVASSGVAARRMATRAAALLCSVIIATSALTALQIRKMPADYGADNDLHKLCAFLEEKELDYGYATFWQSQAITLLSSGDVFVNCVSADKFGVNFRHYQSSREWYDREEDDCFILLTEAEYSAVRGNSRWTEWIENDLVAEYDDVEGYRIFVFSRKLISAS